MKLPIKTFAHYSNDRVVVDAWLMPPGLGLFDLPLVYLSKGNMFAFADGDLYEVFLIDDEEEIPVNLGRFKPVDKNKMFLLKKRNKKTANVIILANYRKEQHFNS